MAQFLSFEETDSSREIATVYCPGDPVLLTSVMNIPAQGLQESKALRQKIAPGGAGEVVIEGRVHR